MSDDNIWKNKCKNYKKLSHILPKSPRIVAIGDLHGDLNVLIKIFKFAKLVDKNHNWIAEPSNTIVVQVGDQLDSCRPSRNIKCGQHGDFIKNKSGDLLIFKYLYNINKKAQKKGGLIINLLGNHELMNVLGDLRYNSKNDINSVKYFDINNKKKINVNDNDLYEYRKFIFKNGNHIANFMACTRQSAIIIGSNLFVHAGILPELAKKYNIEEVNTLIRKWLLNIINIDNDERNIGSVKDIINNINISPFWNRLFGKIPKNVSLDNNDCKKYLLPTLELWNVSNIIIGHTPTFLNGENLNSTCDNKLWRIDVGLSSSFLKDNKFKTQFLEITNDNIFKIYEISDNKCYKIN